MSAADAIDLLSRETDGVGKLDLQAPQFPGPIAEAAYWDDGSVVGIQGPVGCLSADSEVLTRAGWVRIDQWDRQDILVWRAGSAWFEAPRDYIRLPCREFWRFSQPDLSMVLSDEHRMPLIDDQDGPCVRLAADVAARPQGFRVPVSFEVLGPPAMSDARVRLCLAIAASGCLPARGRQVVMLLRNERKMARLRELLAAASMRWKEHQFVDRASEVTFAFSREAWMATGFALWDLPSHQLEVAIDELVHWDGCYGFTTSDRTGADFIQFAAHATGRRASISTYQDPRLPDWRPIYTVRIADADPGWAHVRLEPAAIERVPSQDGRKYCFTTSTGFFVARHAGRIFVTGNSGKTTTILKSRTRRAMSVPRSTIDGTRRYKLLVIRATYRQLWSTTIPDFLGVYPKNLGDWAGGKGGPVTFVMRFADGTSVPPPPNHDGEWSDEIEFIVEFMAFGDDIEGAMRGYQATDIWLHEMDTNPIDVILNGITRINRYPSKLHFAGYPPELQDFGQIVGDFNAPEPDNWIVGLFHDPAKREGIVATMNAELPEGAKAITINFHRQPGFGEPGAENLQNLSPAYYPTQIATMKLLGRGDKVDRLVYNKIVHSRAGEPVFGREYRRGLHVSAEPLAPWPGVPLRIGLDQGFKGAAVIGQVLIEGVGLRRRVFWQILGELHFPAERLMARVFGQRLSDLLETRWPGLSVEAAWGDMAGEHGASQAADENATWNKLVSTAAGFRVRPQKIGTNRLQPRLEAVRAALEAPIDAGRTGIVIDPSCRLLIAAFEGRYVWTEEVDARGDKRKVPDKRLTEANVMDACQYLLLSEHRPDGTSPMSFPDQSGQPGQNRSLSLRGEDQGGLQRGFDILNPYGGL